MSLNIGKEVAALQRMTVRELRTRYAEVFGEETRAGNKPWLIKRIAWRLQSLAEGGKLGPPNLQVNCNRREIGRLRITGSCRTRLRAAQAGQNGEIDVRNDVRLQTTDQPRVTTADRERG